MKLPDAQSVHAGTNPLPRFPLSELAPYPAGSHAWNTGGQDFERAQLAFPMFLLDYETQRTALQLAARNAKQVCMQAEICVKRQLRAGDTSTAAGKSARRAAPSLAVQHKRGGEALVINNAKLRSKELPRSAASGTDVSLNDSQNAVYCLLVKRAHSLSSAAAD